MASNNTNDFYVQLMAALDPTSVNKEFDALKKKLAKDPVIQKVTLDTSMSKQAIKDMATEIHNELGKAFKETGIESFDITVKDVESILASAVKESNKLAKELDTASSKAQKFLAQFNNKSGGTLVNSKEFKAVQDAINGLGNTHTIDDLNKAMNTLETTYNNMVSSLRNSGKSLNPFINAKNEMATMDDTIKGIGLEFEKLANKPKSVSDAIKQLSVQQSNVNSHTIGTQEWADAYGKLQQMIQKVKSEISNLQKAQSANVSTQIFNTADLDKQGKVYIQKVRNTIEAIKPELESKLRSAGYTDIEIKGVEKANGQIKSLTATVTDATGAFKQLNFQREKIQGKGKAQFGFVQTDDVKVIGTLSSSVEKVQGNLSTLKSKWEEQSVLVGDFKTKVEQLETSLASVGSKGELNGLKTQIETLKNEASQIAEVNKIQLLSNGGIKNDYATQIAKLEGNFRSLGMVQDTINSKTQNVKNSLATLRAEFAKPVDQQNFQVIQTVNDNLQRELIESTNEYERLKASMKGMATEQQRLSLANTIEAWNQKNTRATREVVDENHRYIMSLRDLSVEMRKVDFDRINTGFKQNENSMRAMNRLGKSLKEQFKQAYESFTMWLSASSLVMKVVSETKQAITELKDVNTLLTEISKANDKLTKEQLAKIADDGFDTASKYGKKVTDYLSGVQEASRAGYKNAEAIAELSVAIQGAGDVTEDVANSYVIATDKAYKLGGSVEALTEVFDGTNKITNLNAVNMSELAEAMTIVGSTAASFGVEVDETTAAIATMSAVTQQSGSEVARAFRAILLNIRQVSDEEEGIDAEGLTKYEKACNALGVSLKETKNGVLETRDAMDVLKELSEEYVKLDENDLRRTELLNSVGGKLRATQLDALLRNFDTYETMLQQYADGTGSMAREANFCLVV